MTYQSGRHFLQIPGPTNVPDRVLRAMRRHVRMVADIGLLRWSAAQQDGSDAR